MLEDQIGQAYSGYVLKEIHSRFFSSFITRYPDFFRSNSLDLRSLDRVSIPKTQLVRVVAIVFSNPSALDIWIQTLPEPVFQALNLVSWKGAIEIAQLEREIGCPVLEFTKGKKTQTRLKDPFCLFQHHSFKSFWGAKGNTSYLDIPLVLRNGLKKVLPRPKGLALAESPELSHLKADFEDDGRILKALPLINRFIQQSQLETTKQGIPRTRSLLRLREICRLQEFYDKQHPFELSCLRTRMIVDLLVTIGNQEKPGDSTSFLKHIFEVYQKIREYPHNWFFSHIKGMFHCRDGFNHRLHLYSWDLIKNLPENQWITVGQIREFADLTSVDLSPVERKNADRYLYITTEWQGWGNKKRYLTPQYHESVLVIPVLKATLFFFASFGLLDLVIKPPENREVTSSGKSYLTIFDGLEAVRLTETGAFVAGKRTFPVQLSKEEEVAFELDSDRLFINCSGPDQLAGISLERFAARIGPRRFLVDAGSFLKDCKDKQGLLDKISIFKKEVCSDLPPLWQQFFNRLLTRTGVLVPMDDMLVFKLSSNSVEDIDIIAGDRVLKQCILKAEGRHILVRRENVLQMKNRLEELGYLM